MLYLDMLSLCSGPLCDEKALQGMPRGQARKAYDGMCPSCYHALRGSQIQKHRSGGASGACQIWPSCTRWLQHGCGGYLACLDFVKVLLSEDSTKCFAFSQPSQLNPLVLGPPLQLIIL